MNQIDLNERIAVITGGSGGIGLATAKRMESSSATIVLWDIDEAGLTKAQNELNDATCVPVDVTDEESVKKATADTIAKFGRIDILVNGAGATNPAKYVVEYPLELWNRMFLVNATSAFLCSREVVPHMKERDYGRIINLGSVSGKDGNPFSCGYSASKAAVHSLTKSLGKELAETGIRVNAVAPAIVATENLYHKLPDDLKATFVSRVPMGRPGEPSEVAAMITWLASEECSYSTGALFDLSGGRATY